MIAEKLQSDYKFLLDLIYEGRAWKIIQRHRYKPHINYRHIVRAIICEFRGNEATLRDICNSEAIIFEISTPDHSTIISSQRFFKEVLRTEYPELIARVRERYQEHLEQEKNLDVQQQEEAEQRINAAINEFTSELQDYWMRLPDELKELTEDFAIKMSQYQEKHSSCGVVK